MRLLQLNDHGDLSLSNDLLHNIPPYAILSHTWGVEIDEVTFDDIQHGGGKSKTGYAKILFCGRQARKDGIYHFWVDTCCINKASHAELSEAIASMFRWYKQAVKCYVYLSDVSARKRNDQGETAEIWKTAFQRSRWFTRGWTLQELLAPQWVEFFSREEDLLGSKVDVEDLVHKATGLPLAAIRGAPLSTFSVRGRLLWAADRHTTRIEDKAYSLQGIFGVYIPLIYGEGEHAMVRLQEEIAKRSISTKETAPSSNGQHWLVSRSANPFFTGRNDLLRGLTQVVHDAVANATNEGQCRIVITGIGGLGKSEVCLQLARRLRDTFWGVFWLDVSTTALAESSFLDIANSLSITSQNWENARLGIANLKHPWLLVLDNADDLEVDYQHYFPDSAYGVVLLTSRNYECQQYATTQPISLEGLCEKEARELLLRATVLPQDQHKLQEHDANNVAALLQYHQLALIQAGAYISHGHCTLADYPRIFARQRQRLLAYRPNQARSRYGDSYATFEASACSLEASETEAAPDALQLLSLLAMCSTRRLHLSLFEATWEGARSVPSDMADEAEDVLVELLTPWHVDHLPSVIDSRVAAYDASRLKAALHQLKLLSLISTDNYKGSLSVSMHPLVHAWARDRQEPAERHRNWIQMGCALALAYGKRTSWQVDASQLEAHIDVLTRWDADTIFAAESPIPVTRVVVNCGWLLYTLRCDRKLGTLLMKIMGHLHLSWTEVEQQWTGLYSLAAQYLSRTGRATEAIDLLEQAVSVQERTSPATPLVLRLQRELAREYVGNGQKTEALRLLQTIVKDLGETVLVDDPDLLSSEHSLARAYGAAGQVPTAVELLERVVKVRRQSLIETHAERLHSEHDLATYLWEVGDRTDAIDLMARVATLRREVLPEHDLGRLASEEWFEHIQYAT